MNLPDGRNPRGRGAIAGLVPTLVIALLFAVGGTSATPLEVAWSLTLVALIAMTAGWLAGPLASGEPRRLLVATLGYAIALIVATASFSVIQGVGDAVAADRLDPIAILGAIVGRAVYALAGAAYLILPAIALGAVWSVAARGLTTLSRSRPA